MVLSYSADLLPTELLIGVLSATAACAKYLKNRNKFFATANVLLIKRGGKRMTRQLLGLECVEEQAE
jgi:hypothetical protein